MWWRVWYVAVPAVRTVKTVVLHKDIIKKQQEEAICQESLVTQQEPTQDYTDLVSTSRICSRGHSGPVITVADCQHV